MFGTNFKTANHLLRSAFRVLCRLAMLASKAAKPLRNSCSSRVLNVDQEVALQSEAKDFISQDVKEFSYAVGFPVYTDASPICRHRRACWDWDCSVGLTAPSLGCFRCGLKSFRAGRPFEMPSLLKARPRYFRPS